MIRCRELLRFSTMLSVILLIAACGSTPPPAPSVAPTSAPAPTQAAAAPIVPTSAPAPTQVAEVTAEATSVRQEPGPATGAEGQAGVATTGNYVADLGFRPETDSFGFENYGGQGETNLTADDVRRLFGDQVCASLENDACTLIPPGEQWLQQINKAMDGGHCEGMAVLSDLFYIGKIDPNTFGAPNVPALEIAGNIPLQREIAYWWATQATQPTREGVIKQTPSGIVNTLMTSFAAGREGSEPYSVGIYKRDGTGGHAITPYAVEDRGNGLYWIMVYDNNYPKMPRAIEVNTTNDTWTYSGSTNPAVQADIYEGDANTFTLELTALQPRLVQQDCPFCDAPTQATSGGAGNALLAPTNAQTATIEYNEIWLEGDADLLITDLEGHSVGFRDGKFVNEIAGSTSNANKFGVNVWDNNAEPVYYIPTNIDFTISIDGSRLTEPTTSTITMIGPGYALEVSDIILEPGQVDTLDVSPDGSLMSYRTESGETPFMLVAIETDKSDYMFGVYGEQMAPGEALNLSLSTKEGWLSVDAIDNENPGSYSMVMAKYDDQGEQVFGAEGIGLDPNDVLYIDYLKWPGNGQPMPMDVDRGGDGSIDETLEIADVTDQVPAE